ncbi:MAG TPA: type II secretion system minor pseudopilin GspK [Mariprofundaceae bacterium]|nr:type II secretion system minor pseudopilin GspK [Mariprofundaceae bacterium]
MNARGRERGVALILVLGLLALISAWAVRAASEDQVSLRRIRNMQDSDMAMMEAESGWALARLELKRDRMAGTVDGLDEDWARPHAPYPVDDGQVSVSIADVNRYYNLNDLVRNGITQPQELRIVRRLFAAVDVPQGLADALADWMDADGRPTGYGGVEDSGYLDKPYRIKNAPLDSFAELLLIKGFDADVLHKLARVATVLPVVGGPTRININTASKEVLMAVCEGMSASDAESLIQERQSSPYTADQLKALAQMPFARDWASPQVLKRLTVRSDAFIVRTVGRYHGLQWGEKYVAYRDALGDMHIVSRQRLGWTAQG